VLMLTGALLAVERRRAAGSGFRALVASDGPGGRFGVVHVPRAGHVGAPR